MLRLRSSLVALFAGTIAFSVAVAPAPAATFNNTLYFSTFNQQGSPASFAHSVTYSYNDSPSNLTFGSIVSLTPGPVSADGLIFSPDGKTLLFGGGGNGLLQTSITGTRLGTFTTGGQPVYHLALSPDGKIVYGGGGESSNTGVATVPTNPFANGTTHSVSGPDTIITGIAFDKNGNAFYTSAPGGGGFGNFGTINLNTFTTTRILTGLRAAHGIIFDPFTNDFFLVGDNQISQIDPANPSSVIATLTINNASSFDQGAADGLGHLFVGANNGILTFVDYRATGNIGTATFTTSPFLLDTLDDVAPLSGLGSQANGVPEPASLTLLGLGVAAVAGWCRRRRRAAA